MVLVPETRFEAFLAKIAGQEGPDLEPITRTEAFLDDIADGENNLEPRTRFEYWLQKIAENAGGGGIPGYMEEVTLAPGSGDVQAGASGQAWTFTVPEADYKLAFLVSTDTTNTTSCNTMCFIGTEVWNGYVGENGSQSEKVSFKNESAAFCRLTSNKLRVSVIAWAHYRRGPYKLILVT